MSNLEQFMFMTARGGPEPLLLTELGFYGVRNGLIRKINTPAVSGVTGASPTAGLLYSFADSGTGVCTKYQLLGSTLVFDSVAEFGPGTRRPKAGYWPPSPSKAFRPDGQIYAFIPSTGSIISFYEVTSTGADTFLYSLTFSNASSLNQIADIQWTNDGDTLIVTNRTTAFPINVWVFTRTSGNTYVEASHVTLPNSNYFDVPVTRVALDPLGRWLVWRTMTGESSAGVGYDFRIAPIVSGAIVTGSAVVTSLAECGFSTGQIAISPDGVFLAGIDMRVYRINLDRTLTLAQVLPFPVIQNPNAGGHTFTFLPVGPGGISARRHHNDVAFSLDSQLLFLAYEGGIPDVAFPGGSNFAVYKRLLDDSWEKLPAPLTPGFVQRTVAVDSSGYSL
jgi:hypothetical protein